MRHNRKLDAVPLGLAPGPSDNLIRDIQTVPAQVALGIFHAKAASGPDKILKALNSRIYPLVLVDELGGPILRT